jgi:hypothetical protein
MKLTQRSNGLDLGLPLGLLRSDGTLVCLLFVHQWLLVWCLHSPLHYGLLYTNTLLSNIKCTHCTHHTVTRHSTDCFKHKHSQQEDHPPCTLLRNRNYRCTATCLALSLTLTLQHDTEQDLYTHTHAHCTHLLLYHISLK